MKALAAFTWLAFDCAMMRSWYFASALGMPGPLEQIGERVIDHAGRNWFAIAHPLTTIVCWSVAAWWAAQHVRRAYILALPFLAVSAAFAWTSIGYIDPSDWMMSDRPSTLWQWLTVLAALSFLYAWAFTPKSLFLTCGILLTGFVLGMLGAFQDYICGPQPPFLQGSVCGGSSGEQYVRYVLTAAAGATLITFGVNVRKLFQ